MKQESLLKKRILAFVLSLSLLPGMAPGTALAAEMPQGEARVESEMESMAQEEPAAQQETIVPEFSLGSKAALEDNGAGGKLVAINESWVANAGGRGASVSFADTSVFLKGKFTLYANILWHINDDKNIAFSIGEGNNYMNLSLSKGGILYYKANGGAEQSAAFLKNASQQNTWCSIALAYEEADGGGKVTLYIDGEKALDQVAVGFSLSGLSGVSANLGGGFPHLNPIR